MVVKDDVLPPILLLLESPNADHKKLRQLCEQTLDIVQQFLSYIDALKSALNLSYPDSNGNKKRLSTIFTLISMTDQSPISCALFTLNNGMHLCLKVLKV